MEKVTLLYITDHYYLGGDTRSEYFLIDAMDRSRFDITAVVPREGGTADAFRQCRDIDLVPTYLGTGHDPIAEVVPKTGRFLHFVRGILGVGRVARALRPDIVFVGDRTRPMIAGRYAAGVAHTALAYHPQFYFDRSFRNAPLKRSISCAADIVITHSQHSARTYQSVGVRPERVLVAYNAIDGEKFTPGSGEAVRAQYGIDPSKFVIGICGIVGPYKGHEYLIRALHQVRDQMPDAHLIVVGEGECRPALEALTRSLGIEDRATFVGFQTNTVPFFRAMDLFVMASLEEPFGLVTIEAMGCEKPVVGTNTGGTPEIVVDGETGLLVPSGQVEPLAQKILEMYRSPERRREMGLRGRKRVLENFTVTARTQKVSDALVRLKESRSVLGSAIKQ